MADSQSSARNQEPARRRIHFMANCVYQQLLAGGDIHFFEMANAVLKAGCELHFFGGLALTRHVKERQVPASVIQTDRATLELRKVETLKEQWILFWNYFGRFIRTLPRLKEIERNDIAYAVTDYWFDTLPVLLSKARGKAMSLGMDAPTLREIIRRSRPDVPPNRLSSLYYWFSQNLSLRLFRWARNKRITYVHPTMKARLLRIGFREHEIAFVSNGMNMQAADSVPSQPKEFDIIWVGRVHVQKGIQDLIDTIGHLASRVPGLRVVVAGRKLEETLKPKFDSLGVGDCVKFAGLVSEEEKFRLFKASRLFLMPSRYESWGIVIAEALVSGTPVVAYDLEAYRPIFGDLVRYVPCFDSVAFTEAAYDELVRARKDQTKFDPIAFSQFRDMCSWEAAGRRFVKAIDSL